MIDNRKKITLIITVYNGEKYLRACLDSVIRQTYKAFELILIDDGSNDGSPDIADEYQNKYPEFMKTIHQKNGGLSNARNTGLKFVNGDYIAFADADDMLQSDYLETLYNAAIDTDSDYIICGYTRIDEMGRCLGIRNAKDWEMSLDDGKNHVFTYTAWGRLYRSELIQESGMRFSEGEGLEDIPFNIYMNIVARKCTAIDYCGYLYRISSTSVTEAIKKDGVKAASKVMRFPYNGLQNTVCLLLQNYGTKYNDILIYELIKNFTGLLFFAAEASDKETLRMISNFEYNLLQQNFGSILNNPYIRIGRFKKLPLSYRLAVRLFVKAYSSNRIYHYARLYQTFKMIKKIRKV